MLKAGVISFNTGSKVECTVRRFSSYEAQLLVSSTAVLPDSFKLSIAGDGLSRMCRIIERQGTVVTVAI